MGKLKKIEFKIDDELWVILIGINWLKMITSYSGKLENGGYIFVTKVNKVKELEVSYLTEPHINDTHMNNFIKFSRSHRRIAKKINRENPELYEIGFYHTHPEEFGSNASSYDLEQFKKKSQKYFLSLFIIGISNKVNVFIYSKGVKIMEDIICL